MTYKETLRLARINNISPLDLWVATEVESLECRLDFNLNKKQFEDLTEMVREAYLKAQETEVAEICDRVEYLLNNGDTIDKLLKRSVWDLLK